MIRLAAIHFYKVIELVIRSDACLSREMVKHLNKVYYHHFRFFFLIFLGVYWEASLFINPSISTYRPLAVMPTVPISSGLV